MNVCSTKNRLVQKSLFYFFEVDSSPDPEAARCGFAPFNLHVGKPSAPGHHICNNQLLVLANIALGPLSCAESNSTCGQCCNKCCLLSC